MARRLIALTMMIGAVWSGPILSKNFDKNPADQPKLSGYFPAKLRFQVSNALRLASDQLESSQTCRDLYRRYGVEGRAVLYSATYRVAQSDHGMSVCSDRSAAAFTSVGSSNTTVCAKLFATLSVHRAAVILIHESLHHSGMTEWPYDREALRSTEINTLIRDRCGL